MPVIEILIKLLGVCRSPADSPLLFTSEASPIHLRSGGASANEDGEQPTTLKLGNSGVEIGADAVVVNRSVPLFFLFFSIIIIIISFVLVFVRVLVVVVVVVVVVVLVLVLVLFFCSFLFFYFLPRRLCFVQGCFACLGV
jgi:hypothetical protein